MKKETFLSKTFWAGIAGIATGIGMITQGAVVEGVQTITVAVLAIFGRDAVAKMLQ